MKPGSCIKSAAIVLGLVAAIIAAYESMLSRGSLYELGETIGALETRIESGEESLGSRLSRSVSGLEGRLSDLSRRIEIVRREAQSRYEASLEAIVGKDGKVPAKASGELGDVTEKPESRATSDGAFARILEEAEKAYSESRFADAAARYGAILRWAPEEKEPRFKRAISLYRANPSDSSSYSLIERELQDLLAAGGVGKGEYGQALEILALLSVERQDWRKAAAYFDRLIELRPDDAGLLREAQECARYAEESAREEER